MPITKLFGGPKARPAAIQAAAAQGPIETLSGPDQATMVAGGRELRGALGRSTAYFDAAIYSSRGRGYANYNEDAACLFDDAEGAIYAAAFDQAGGLGGEVRGAASERAAHAFFAGFQRIATGQRDPPTALREALDEAHAALVERDQDEVTTAVTLAAGPTTAFLLTSGDSGALHFSPEGALLAQAELHHRLTPRGIYGITHAVGLHPEGASPEAYTWKLSTGDAILLCSDGLLDAGLSSEELGALAQRPGSAVDAVNHIVRKVLRRMAWLRAKPDNLTVVLVRAQGDGRAAPEPSALEP